MRHLVVGAGEVGAALHAVLSRHHDTRIRDVGPVDVQAEVLHICFPWSPQFPEQVREYTSEHGASLVIVHSTVPVGTCDREGWIHSPVRGRHPDLIPAMTAFVKHCGGERADEAAKPLEAAGIRCRIHRRAVETEAGKLFELVQFGHQVQVQHAIYAWCAEQGIDPQVVYGEFAETYNQGYVALDEPRFVRPVLEFMPGRIGGHCVRQCAAMLEHPLAAMVAKG